MKIVSKIKGRVRRLLCSRRLQKLVETHTPEVTRLGSSHGGWTVPTSQIRSGRNAVLVGAGEDISFDVELNKRGMRVFTLDPTPRAKEHVRQVLATGDNGSRLPIDHSKTEFYDLRGFDKERLILLDVGVWNEDTSMRFFAPKEKSHVSHSIVNLQHTTEWFEAKCMTLRSICEWQNIRDIDILKLDIEGAEYPVLKDVVESGFRPPVLCVEFDEIRNPLKSGYMGRIQDAMDMLKRAGYKFRHIEESNALFVRDL
jgi:FkbM family methyltransferase